MFTVQFSVAEAEVTRSVKTIVRVVPLYVNVADMVSPEWRLIPYGVRS